MSFSADDITGYFDTYGWKYERRDPTIYRTGFVGETGHYDIWLKVTDSWVYFAINPYVPKPDGKSHGSGTLTAVLRANHELNLAKFAVDDDGDVLLSVELPLEGFCYTHFADALTALAHYADDYRGRIEEAVAADQAEVV
jgi:hypothetical protein